MEPEDITVSIVRLRRVLAGAQRRHARRHNRSSAIWSGYKGYYGRNPSLGSHWHLAEEWDDKHRRWPYEEAYCLELEASILMNWLTVLLNQAIHQRGPLPRRGVTPTLA